MPFGKRRTVPTPKPDVVAIPAPAEPSPAERLETFRDAMLGLLDGAARIADAIRDQGSIPMPVIDEEPDPEVGPLSIKGFTDHFVHLDQGRIRHSLIAYPGAADQPGEADAAAQEDLHNLTTRILELNQFCQQAELDGALGVALQAPVVAPLVDGILIEAAYFAGALDNALAALGEDRDSLERQQALSRHLLMATDRMLDPHGCEHLAATTARPPLVVTVTINPHDGDCFLNGVYFPADRAGHVLAVADRKSPAI